MLPGLNEFAVCCCLSRLHWLISTLTLSAEKKTIKNMTLQMSKERKIYFSY